MTDCVNLSSPYILTLALLLFLSEYVSVQKVIMFPWWLFIFSALKIILPFRIKESISSSRAGQREPRVE